MVPPSTARRLQSVSASSQAWAPTPGAATLSPARTAKAPSTPPARSSPPSSEPTASSRPPSFCVLIQGAPRKSRQMAHLPAGIASLRKPLGLLPVRTVTVLTSSKNVPAPTCVWFLFPLRGRCPVWPLPLSSLMCGVGVRARQKPTENALGTGQLAGTGFGLCCFLVRCFCFVFFPF